MYGSFDDWWEELENYSTRSERAYDELGSNALTWLKTAWSLGEKSNRKTEKGPYKTIFSDDKYELRVFDRDKYGNPNIWHEDRVDRKVRLISSKNCKALLQMDNQIPLELGQEYVIIPAYYFHRLILEGNGWVVIEIRED